MNGQAKKKSKSTRNKEQDIDAARSFTAIGVATGYLGGISKLALFIFALSSGGRGTVHFSINTTERFLFLASLFSWVGRGTAKCAGVDIGATLLRGFRISRSSSGTLWTTVQAKPWMVRAVSGMSRRFFLWTMPSFPSQRTARSASPSWRRCLPLILTSFPFRPPSCRARASLRLALAGPRLRRPAMPHCPTSLVPRFQNRRLSRRFCLTLQSTSNTVRRSLSLPHVFPN